MVAFAGAVAGAVIAASVAASAASTSISTNATVKRPDSGMKHRIRSPGLTACVRRNSSSMMKIDAAPVLPRVTRLLYQRPRGIASPAFCISSSTTGANFSDE